jgi:dihydroorotase
MKIVIKNGRVIDPANQCDQICDVVIENEKIITVGNLAGEISADKIIDATNKWVIPGIVDICCRPHMQHPHGTTLREEANAALKRGITTLCIPPDVDPVIEKRQNLSPQIYPFGALTTRLAGKTLSDLTALAQAGCIAFTNAQHPIVDLQVLKSCYDYAASFDLTVIIQPQDPWLGKGGIAHDGVVAMRLGLPGIPACAESIAIAQHLELIEVCNVRAHFTCLSSAAGVDLIATAKARGLKVTADTAMHQLHLTEMDVQTFDANCHVYPPLRSMEDCHALLAGVNDGTIDAICSDHRPLDSVAKLAPFGDTQPGISAIDTFLALGIHLVQQKKLDAWRLIKAISDGPARCFQLPNGTLSKGAMADLCIVDPNQYWVVSEEKLYSQGKNSPFKGWEIPGMVSHTIFQGDLVYGA